MVALDLVTVVAVVLLAAGIVGSAIPSLPGPLVSLAGIAAYFFGGGTDVGAGTLAVLALVAGLAVIAEWFAGTLAAKYGGASWGASILGGLVGILLFFVVGPIGVILGIAGTIFAIEAVRKDPRHATKAATYSTIGALGSVVVQVLLTLGLFLTFVLAIAV